MAAAKGVIMKFRHILALVWIGLYFLSPVSLDANIVSSGQAESDIAQETYNLTLIARKSLEVNLYTQDHVYETALQTLKKLNHEVFRSDRHDGVVISRIHNFRVRLSTTGGGDIFFNSNPVDGRHFFLVLKIVFDDSGKQKLDCMIANRFRDGNRESLGERLLKRFVNELESELSSQVQWLYEK